VAPTLVFLHGGLACLETWHDFPEKLARKAGCGALVYSRRGHGGSGPGPSKWPVAFMHDEARRWLPAVLDKAGVRWPILVGHSDGASIAVLYAARKRAGGPAPMGLALLAPHVFVEDKTVDSIAALTRGAERREMLKRLRRRHGRKASALFEAWTGVWLRGAFRRWSIQVDVGRVRCPILVAQGDEDEFGTLAQVAAVRKRARSPCESQVVKGCGHVLHRDCTAETVAAVAGFIRRRLGVSSGAWPSPGSSRPSSTS
jgi:pimeloyl-ACP methyl ester carboxylesterase